MCGRVMFLTTMMVAWHKTMPLPEVSSEKFDNFTIAEYTYLLDDIKRSQIKYSLNNYFEYEI